MPHNPTVSVVIPCYNYGRFIDDAIGSVLKQTYNDYEIIVVDDGSTDTSTIEKLHSIKYDKVKVIFSENKGTSGARNLGISNAKGKYILTLDADDKISEHFLEKAVEIMQSQENISVVYPRVKYFGAKFWYQRNKKPYSFPDILIDTPMCCSSLFKREEWEKVGGFDEGLVYGKEDYDFWLSIVALGGEVRAMDEVLYYRQHFIFKSRDNAMNRDKYTSAMTRIYENHKDMYNDNMQVVWRHVVELRSDNHLKKVKVRKLWLLLILSWLAFVVTMYFVM